VTYCKCTCFYLLYIVCISVCLAASLANIKVFISSQKVYFFFFVSSRHVRLHVKLSAAHLDGQRVVRQLLPVPEQADLAAAVTAAAAAAAAVAVIQYTRVTSNCRRRATWRAH